MVRVIPGVEVKVVKEIVPQQLFPAGVVGMIGTANDGPVGIPTAVTSYRELTEIFGQEELGFTLHRDAKNAFLNGVFQVVATRVGGSASSPAFTALKGRKRVDVLKLVSKDLGEAGNKINIVVLRGASENTFRLEIASKSAKEEFDNLSMVKGSDMYAEKIITENSRIVSAQTLVDEPTVENTPVPSEGRLSGGKFAPPAKRDFENALEALELETTIDTVHICDTWDPEIHALVDAHCQNMSLGKEPKPLGPRIGIGTVGPNEPVDQIIKRTELIASDRFIIVAPYGLAGAVAGLISKLDYYESPTFKPLTGIANIERRYTPSEQMKLLTNGILTVDAVRGRGIIVVKGITTSREQISVMRVADRAVRGVKNIADNFIGTLNNSRGRLALKERLREFFVGMEREGSIVPSTDLTQPAFLIDVYSSQADFAQGIVHTDIAVRPVRAMDYIYGMVTVQA
jgi:Phage tail sheath protein subtilisin-like domain